MFFLSFYANVIKASTTRCRTVLPALQNGVTSAAVRCYQRCSTVLPALQYGVTSVAVALHQQEEACEHAAPSRACLEAARPNCATMFAVARPVMILARPGAVAREPTPSAFARRACSANRAHIVANNCVQFDLQQHPL